MAKMKYWNGTTWEVTGTDADKVELKDNNDLFQANNVEDALVEIKQDLDTHKAANATLSEKGHVNHGVYNITLDTTWSGSSAPFSKTQTVTGILATDTPIVDVVMSGTYATDEARQEAWSNIYRITTANDSITLYAKEKPTVNLPIQIKVVR